MEENIIDMYVRSAPDGCTQYFTGSSGTFRSYHFGLLLDRMSYTTCIRQEFGNNMQHELIIVAKTKPDRFF